MPEEARLVAQPRPSQAGDGSREPGAEYASEFCPVCSRRLAARACKLVCSCGYYMSCSDYY